MATHEQKLALLYSAGQPNQAILLDGSLSVQDYFDLLKTDEYIEFAEEQQKYFYDNVEGMLLHRLNSLSTALRTMLPTEKNYPTIQRELTNLLKITQPIIERLAKVSKELQTFDGLEIRIMGVDDGGEKE